MKDKNIKLSGTPCFSPPGSAAPRKRLSKPVLILFALAIIFAILGFIDLKVNAAESDTYVSSTYTVTNHYIKYVYDGNGTETSANISDFGSYTSTSPIYVYYYVSYDYPIATNHELNAYCISKGQLSENAVSFTYNNETWYLAVSFMSGGIYSDGGGYFEFISSGAEKLYKLNSNYDTQNDFITALQNGTLDVKIDYDSLEVDDSLSTINNLLYNIIRNEKPSENDTTGLGIIKDVEYYEYLTWNNTLDLPIQVEYVPIVQVYSGLFSEKFKKEYYGEWSDFLILDAGTNSYTKRTDSEYLFENDRLGIEFEKDIIDKYVEYLDNTYLFYGYRMRYVDVDNGRSGPWVYAVPRVNGTYYSYVEYSDDTVTEEEDITGTDNTYKNLDDISGAQADIDKENAVKDEYGVTDTEISVSEVSTWLSTLVDFIKGSPPLVGSVLSFLPQPILYGMYMLIFLGVVGAGFAIVRALI